MIKNHKNHNDYYYAGNGLWARDFTKKSVYEMDINDLVGEADMKLMLVNETANDLKMLQRIDTECFSFPSIVIISDGYNFDEKHQILNQLPKNVVVIGVHGVLDRWNVDRKMNYYVVNNPYEYCKNYLPKNQKVWPRCIASTRTNSDFVARYNGLVYEYSPVTNQSYAGLKREADYFIDDYRNAICAAIGLSYRFGVKKLAMLCCDDVFDVKKSTAELLPNGLYIYPQQKIAHGLIDANLYWLKKQGIEIVYNDNGPECKNATYIKSLSDLIKFFAD